MLRDPTAPIDGALNGKDSKANAGLAARLSSANLASKHIIDKRINKMLFNMHGIPVQPNVTNQQQQQQQQQQNKQKKNKKEQKEQEKLEKLEKEKQEKQEKQDKKGNRKRKQVIEQHV
jgi:exonuclease I